MSDLLPTNVREAVACSDGLGRWSCHAEFYYAREGGTSGWNRVWLGDDPDSSKQIIVIYGETPKAAQMLAARVAALLNETCVFSTTNEDAKMHMDEAP